MYLPHNSNCLYLNMFECVCMCLYIFACVCFDWYFTSIDMKMFPLRSVSLTQLGTPHTPIKRRQTVSRSACSLGSAWHSLAPSPLAMVSWVGKNYIWPLQSQPLSLCHSVRLLLRDQRGRRSLGWEERSSCFCFGVRSGLENREWR